MSQYVIDQEWYGNMQGIKAVREKYKLLATILKYFIPDISFKGKRSRKIMIWKCGHVSTLIDLIIAYFGEEKPHSIKCQIELGCQGCEIPLSIHEIVSQKSHYGDLTVKGTINYYLQSPEKKREDREKWIVETNENCFVQKYALEYDPPLPKEKFQKRMSLFL